MFKRIALALAVVVAVTAPAYAQTGKVTKEDVARAAEARKQASLQLADAITEYDHAVVEAILLEDDLARLASALTDRERDLTITKAEARQVAQALYMNAGVGQLDVFTAGSVSEWRLGAGYLDRASQQDEATLARLRAVKESYLDQQQILEESLTRQREINEDLDRLAGEMLIVLQAADDEYRVVADQWSKQEAARIEAERKAREAEEARRRAATSTTSTTAGPGTTQPPGGTTTTTTTLTPPPPQNGKACPVNGAVSFTDTWGAPRSGGRGHQGVDMMANRGVPVVAIEDGAISSIGNSGLGGKTIWLRSDTGDTYYYAHLDGFASGLSVGDNVDVGELIGYVGNTGNAAYTAPHLHFEYHPNGGSAVNPYPLARDLCL